MNSMHRLFVWIKVKCNIESSCNTTWLCLHLPLKFPSNYLDTFTSLSANQLPYLTHFTTTLKTRDYGPALRGTTVLSLTHTFYLAYQSGPIWTKLHSLTVSYLDWPHLRFLWTIIYLPTSILGINSHMRLHCRRAKLILSWVGLVAPFILS